MEDTIYAKDSMIGKIYYSKTNIPVRIFEKKINRVIFESLKTGNFIFAPNLYILKISDEEVKNNMVKKTNVKIEKVKVEKVKKIKEGGVYVDWNLIEPLFAKGLPLKVNEILEKVKVEATNHSAYARVYVTLKRAVKEGLIKIVGKGTFQKNGIEKVEKPKIEKSKKEVKLGKVKKEKQELKQEEKTKVDEIL
jgi:hypothetical protein